MARPAVLQDYTDLHFPKAGIDRSGPFSRQPNRPAADGVYARTTPLGVNVRVYDPSGKRSRGGMRPGLSKYVSTRVGGLDWAVQELSPIVGTFGVPGGGVPQTSQSGRVVLLVAVVQGNVYTCPAGGTAWTAANNITGESPPLNFSGIVHSTNHLQQMFFADGTNYCFYEPATNTVQRWVASAGELPRDSHGNAPRLITTWRGRIVLSGLLYDPHNWFMSAVADSLDFDYGPLSPSPADAVAGNNEMLGQIGDVVTGLCPHTDDCLFFFGDHTTWLMRGDPLAGGQIDRVSDAIGAAWGKAFTMDPTGTVWFLSNTCRVYTVVPGAQPVPRSSPIDPILRDINTGTHGVRLLWNEARQELHIFVTKLAATAATTHFVFEAKTGAWWEDTFANNDLNPLACCVLDGNLPGDRVALIGGWDGYVRKIDPDASDDDGTTITSTVWIGPLLTPTMHELIITEIQAVLSQASGTVTCAVHVGNSAEAAFNSTAVHTISLSAGRSTTHGMRRAGHAIYLKLTATTPWAMEQVRARLEVLGLTRQRGR